MKSETTPGKSPTKEEITQEKALVEKSTKKPSPTTPTTKTSDHAKRYVVIGVILTLFNYGLYAILSNLIFVSSELNWLSSLISTAITTILAYVLHSKITWKERKVTTVAIYKFFIWNGLLTFPISPGLTQLFTSFTPLYDLAYNICQNLHLDFSYEFIQSTGAFVLTTAIIMIMNFLLYDKFVFGKKSLIKSHKKEEEK